MSRYDCKMLVVCGPSGSGKSSLLNQLFHEYPQRFGYSVSHTSRNPRPGEVDGEHYHFTTKEKIEEGIQQGLFLETAVFSGNYYGTSVDAVQEVCKTGKICVLDIEIEGVKQVKQKDLDLILVFIKPPSMDELEKRLRGRGTESEENLKQRLATARKEMEYGETKGNFDAIIVNDELEKSYNVFKSFIIDQLFSKYKIVFNASVTIFKGMDSSCNVCCVGG